MASTARAGWAPRYDAKTICWVTLSGVDVENKQCAWDRLQLNVNFLNILKMWLCVLNSMSPKT